MGDDDDDDDGDDDFRGVDSSRLDEMYDISGFVLPW